MIMVLYTSIYALCLSFLYPNSYIEYHSNLDSMSCLSSSVTLSSPLEPIKGVLEDAGTGTELKVLARVARPRDELTTEGGIYLKKSAREIWRSQTIYQSWSIWCAIIVVVYALLELFVFVPQGSELHHTLCPRGLTLLTLTRTQ